MENKGILTMVLKLLSSSVLWPTHMTRLIQAGMSQSDGISWISRKLERYIIFKAYQIIKSTNSWNGYRKAGTETSLSHHQHTLSQRKPMIFGN
jgi:hypothetical protein